MPRPVIPTVRRSVGDMSATNILSWPSRDDEEQTTKKDLPVVENGVRCVHSEIGLHMRKFLAYLVLLGGLFIVAFPYFSLGWSEEYDAQYKTPTLIAVPILLVFIFGIVIRLWSRNGSGLQVFKLKRSKGRDRLNNETE